ncbi:hypothetical protein Fmac_026873 [Flemingia macrophylla]|uniref:Uncharacterized protein n=1 Tax=Flemingia macrophylla TaxID=520843 RepID=A0ABD1LG37_9FABA
MTGLSLIPLPVPLPASPPLSNWGFRDNRISETSTSDTRKGKLNLASLLIILVYFCANLEFRIALNSISSLNSLLLIGNHFLLGSYYKEGRGRNPCCSDENPNLCLALTLFIHVSVVMILKMYDDNIILYSTYVASDVLLDLAAPTIEKSNTDRHPNYRVDNIGDERFLVDPNDSCCAQATEVIMRSESTSLSSNGDLSDNLWSVGSFDKKYVEVVSSSKADYVGSPGFIKSDIPQKVLESLFNIPKSTEHDKDTMNWRNVVKQIQTLGPGFNPSQRVAESKQRTYAKGDEYHVFREDSQEDWDSMKSYYRNVDTQQLLQQQTNMQADNEDDQQPSSAAGHYGNDY